MATTQYFGILNVKEKEEVMNIGLSVPVRGAMPQPATTRWNPTAEQLMILEDMYRDGIRTPNAQTIQRITARLSLYGKIEGKNVFYWFQNHKARDRQKLRRKMQNTQEEPKSTPLFAEGAGLTHDLDLNNGWIYASCHESRDECCSWSMEEYGREMDSRSATTKPLKTLDLFPTYSGL